MERRSFNVCIQALKAYTLCQLQWRHVSQPLGGLTFPSSYSTTTSLRLLSPCYVMCDTPKTSVGYWIGGAITLSSEKNIANSYCYRNG